MLAPAPRLQTRPATLWVRWCATVAIVMVAGVAAWIVFGGVVGDTPLSAQAQQAPMVASDDCATVLASFDLPAGQVLRLRVAP